MKRGYRDFKRSDRVGELIQRELGLLLLDKISDPRLQNCTITAVEMSDDLRHAKVFYTMIGADEERVYNAQSGFKKARGFLRKIIGDNLELRYVPDLRFVHDASMDYATDMMQKIKKAREKDDGDSSED